MNQKLTSILIAVLWAGLVFGQVEQEVKKVLERKDFVAFKNFADTLSNRENRISAHWACLRDLTSDFQEGVFIFEKSVPDEDNPAISSVYTFRVTMISSKTSIAYYEISEEKIRLVENDKEIFYEAIDRFKDEVAYANFINSFKNLYQIDLDEKDLFVTNFVYGSHCGYTGQNPPGRQQMEAWLKAKNKKEILTWLRSANTEKQVYAVEGLMQLSKSGVKLTDEEQKIMQFICQKSGTIYSCSGCMHFQNDIRSVTAAFKP